MPKGFVLRSFLIGFFVIAACTGVGIAWWRAQPNHDVAQEKTLAITPVGVKVHRIDWHDAQEFNEFAGTVQSSVSVDVMAQITARILTQAARSGMVVKKGALLVELDATEIESRLKQAESNLQAVKAAQASALSEKAAAESRLASAEASRIEAELDNKRFAALIGSDAVSKQQVEQAEAKWKMALAAVETAKANVKTAESAARGQEASVIRAQAQIEETKAQLAYTRIVSPMDGIVVDRYADPGDQASPGRKLLRIQSLSELRFEASVSESCARRIHVDDAVRIRVESANLESDARVSEIVPSVDPMSRSFLVRADLPASAGVQPGLFGRLQFSCAPRKILALPTRALFRRGQLDYAFVVEDGKARLRLIRTGNSVEDKAEILAGLQAGEVVVLDPPPALMDGNPVDAQPEGTKP